MEKINWILIQNKSRGVDFGVGTYIKNILNGLTFNTNIDIFVIDIGHVLNREFSISKENGITYFHFNYIYIPPNQYFTSNQTKRAKSLVRVIESSISKSRRTIIHMNFITHYFLADELKKTYSAHVIYTQHLTISKKNKEMDYFDLENATYQIADQIFTVTDHGREHLINKGVNSKKIKTIYNGFDPELLTTHLFDDQILKKYDIRKNDIFILFSGRLDAIKGLRYLAKSFKMILEEVPKCRLVIAGNGSYDEVISCCRESSSKVNYLGFIPIDDLAVLYNNATIGVIPSLEEQCSYVALEMMHFGLPVVASNIGGLKEIFISGENAILVDMVSDTDSEFGLSPSIDQLTQGIVTLLTNPRLRKRFARNSKQRAASEFSLSNMVNKYINYTINT